MTGIKAAPRFELGVKVLQTSALPLGYAAPVDPRLYTKPKGVELNRLTKCQQIFKSGAGQGKWVYIRGLSI